MPAFTGFTNFIKSTSADAGAKRLSGTNGDMNAWADQYLAAAGWTKTNIGTNDDIWVAPAGRKRPLRICHNSAVSSDARLCLMRAGASYSGGLVDPFPNLTQAPDSQANWIISTLATTAARQWVSYVFDWGFYLFSKKDGTNWDLDIFSDCVSRFSGDTFDTAIKSRHSTSTDASLYSILSASQIASCAAHTSLVNTNVMFAAANPNGSIKSSFQQFGGKSLNATAAFGALSVCSVAPAVGAGISNSTDLVPATLHCQGASTTVIGASSAIDRLALPNLWYGVHSTYAGRDDSAPFSWASKYPTGVFRLYVGSQGAIVVQESNDWSAPF